MRMVAKDRLEPPEDIEAAAEDGAYELLLGGPDC